MNAVVQVPAKLPSASVLVRMATRYGVDPEKMLGTLKATAFKGDVSNEQMMALLVVADQYDLNPWTKEIYAFPSRGGAIVPIVGVDGWSRIINSNPQFDGMDFTEGELDQNSIPVWIECIIYRKDRSHPIRTKEYFKEVDRNEGPWKSHPRRMLRHKAMIQCARLAFGFVGIYDQDEGERIIEAQPLPNMGPRPDLSEVDTTLRDKRVSEITDLIAEHGSDDSEPGKQKLASVLQDYHETYLQPFPELFIAVNDKLASDGIISKKVFRLLLSLALKS